MSPATPPYVGEISVRKLVWVFVAIATIGFSQAHAAVIPACQVENPPENCEKMLAIVAHARLPRQPIAANNPPPRCQSKFESINWGEIVIDALEAEADPDTLENLAMDVSDSFQKKMIPQITQHFRGEASSLIESNFSKLEPIPWSEAPYDQTLCAPVIATLPANATVRGFRFRASDESLGEMGCTGGKVCPIGYCRFVHSHATPQETFDDRVTVYTVIFQNWSTNWAREGRLIIFFEMPPGKVPLEHL
jgi:hypothetical protein